MTAAAASASASNATASTAHNVNVAVIGCGPAGLFFLRQLEKERERLLELKNKIEQCSSSSGCHSIVEEIDISSDGVVDIERRLGSMPHVTVFEKESSCGGLWSSKLAHPTTKTSAEDVDKDTVEGMYDGMWINAPKEIFEFEDYTFDKHFDGKPMSSYLTRFQVLEYLQGATNDVLQKYYMSGDDNGSGSGDDGGYGSHGSIVFDTEVTWVDYNDTTELFSIQYVPTGTVLGTYVR